MKTLFDRDLKRTCTVRIAVGQSQYDFLNKSAWPEAVEARELLDEWFAIYPEEAKPALRARVIADRAETHQGAVFELFLYVLLRACGFDVSVHPRTKEGGSPDFLLRRDGKRVAYLEATIRRGPIGRQNQEEAFDALIQRTSALVTVPGYGIHVFRCQCGERNPSPRRFADFLNRTFRDGGHARLDHPGRSRRPTRFLYYEESSGWRLEFAVSALPECGQYLNHVTLTSNRGTFFELECPERFRAAIKRKCRQHRGADLPLVVAVASNDFLTAPREGDIADALVGSRRWLFSRARPNDTEQIRQRDGIWSKRSKHGGTSLIGVTHVNRCYPWALPSTQIELWDNPWLPEEELLQRWPLTRKGWDKHTGELIRREGVTVAELLGISHLAPQT